MPETARRRVLRSERTRGVGIIVLAVVVGAVAGPPVVAVADDVKGVIIENSSDNPVLSKPVGTTPVKGTVELAEGTAVKLEDGSTVKLADSTVTLAEGAKVAVANDDNRPIPVRVAGGKGAPASEYWSHKARVEIPVDAANASDAYAPADEWYTVPVGKVLVLEGISGHVSNNVHRVWIDRVNCPPPSRTGFIFGTITENARTDDVPGWTFTDVWSAVGTFNFRGGCVLKPSAARLGEFADFASFQLYGRLVDDE